MISGSCNSYRHLLSFAVTEILMYWQFRRWNSNYWMGACGWGTALPAGRSRLRFLVGVIGIFHWLIYPASKRNERQNCLQGRFVGLTALLPSCADCVEILGAQPPGALGTCPGIDVSRNHVVSRFFSTFRGTNVLWICAGRFAETPLAHSLSDVGKK
jgi:hypothetical protein